jgi:HK97 family phage portal protein
MFNIFRRFFSKESLVQKILVQGGTGAIFTPKRYDLFAKEAYLKNIIAYRCITEIAYAVGSIEWGLFRQDQAGKKIEVFNNPVNKILTRANPYESFGTVMQNATAYMVLDGNGFLERKTPMTGPNKGIPMEMYTHRPDRIQILVDPPTGLLTGYKYIVGGRNVVWEVDPITQQGDILHTKHFNPLHDWWGMAPTEANSREIDTFNQGTEWNMALLQNGARPSMVIGLKGTLGPEDFDALEHKLKEKHTGPANAHKMMLVNNIEGVDIKTFGFTPKELDFIEGNRESARRIAYGYGVPPMLIGIPGDNTFSNQKEARLAFWENTVTYYLRMWRGELNNWIFGTNNEGLILDYDIDSVPAMEPRREQLYERAQKSDFLTINEKREMTGHEAMGAEADVILVSATMIPLGSEADNPDNDSDKDKKTEKDIEDAENDL